MTKNVGKTDKIVRIVVSIALAVLVIFEIIPEPYNYVAFGASLVLLLTSVISFCPLYALIGKSTCEKN